MELEKEMVYWVKYISKSEEYREGEEPMGFDQAELVEERDQKHS